MQRDRPALIGSVGRSGAAKTTVITDLIDRLRVGSAVSAFTRVGDTFDLDCPLRRLGSGAPREVADFVIKRVWRLQRPANCGAAG